MFPTPPPLHRRSPGLRMIAAVVLGLAAVGTFALPGADFAAVWRGWFALPLLAALFLLWHGGGVRDGLLIGFGFGLGLFGGGISWVYFSIHDYGNMPPLIASLSVFGLVSVLALYPALVGALQAVLAGVGRRLQLALVMPVLWVLCEWLREWLLTGFPWLAFGYSQSDTLFAAYAPLVGVHGVTLALALCAGALAAMCVGPPQRRVANPEWRATEPGRRATESWVTRLRRRFLLPALIPALLIAGGLYADGLSWDEGGGESLAVAVLQGNVPLHRKWAEGAAPRVRDHYLALSRDALRGAGPPPQPPALVVWPEGAIPGYHHLQPPSFWKQMRNSGAGQVIGMLEQDADGRIYNSAVVVSGDGEATADGGYRKEHLVPFGEYLPWRPLFGWLLNYLQVPMSDLSPWTEAQAPPPVAGVRVGISICYEDIFPQQIRATLPAAELLLNLSEDAWFGNSLAPHQHLQMARMRAMESARYMVRAANTGPSAIIDHRGTVIARSAQFRTEVLHGSVRPLHGITPFIRFGNALIVSLLLLLLAAACVRAFLSKPPPSFLPRHRHPRAY